MAKSKSKEYRDRKFEIVAMNRPQPNCRLDPNFDHIEAEPQKLTTEEPPVVRIKLGTIVCDRPVNWKQESDKRSQNHRVD